MRLVLIPLASSSYDTSLLLPSCPVMRQMTAVLETVTATISIHRALVQFAALPPLRSSWLGLRQNWA